MDYPNEMMLYTPGMIPKLIPYSKLGEALCDWVREPDNIYIGHDWGLIWSSNNWCDDELYWQHIRGKLTTEEYFKKYEEKFKHNPLEELAGKTLACCCDDGMTKCHGRVLQKMFKEYVVDKSLKMFEEFVVNNKKFRLLFHVNGLITVKPR